MSDERNDKTLAALLAKSLLPEAQDELSELDAERIVKEEGALSEDDKQMLTKFNPLQFLGKGQSVGGTIIEFPNVNEQLPLAVGFYRKRTTSDASDKATNEAISRKRKEIEARYRTLREHNQQDVQDK